VHAAPAAAAGLLAAGLDIDLPVAPALCGQAHQNDRFARVRPGAGSQGAPSKDKLPGRLPR